MKFSKSWVMEWVRTELSDNALAEQITMAGLEVDAVEAVAGQFNNVVVGEVVECAQHPDADKLRVTKVNVGEAELLDIVCGAPNCRAGLKVCVAKVGATLPGDFTIKKAKLRGQPSRRSSRRESTPYRTASGPTTTMSTSTMSTVISNLLVPPVPRTNDTSALWIPMFRSWLSLESPSRTGEVLPLLSGCANVARSPGVRMRRAGRPSRRRLSPARRASGRGSRTRPVRGRSSGRRRSGRASRPE